MTIVEPGGATTGLVDRVKNILIQPRAEWERISTERTGLAALLTGYVLPLAALAAICGFIGMTFIGVGGWGVNFKLPLVDGAVGAVVQIVMSMVSLWLVGLLINALAPTFASEPDQTRANQLIVYSSTAGFVGGVFTLLPSLAILGALAGIYSLVLLYIGLPRMMKTPEDKRLPYFITIIVVALVAGIVSAAILGAARTAMGGMGLGGPGMMGAMPWTQHRTVETAPAPGSVTINGQTLDLNAMKQAAEQLGAAANNPQAAQAAAITAEQLKTLLPEALPGGFTRTEISTASSGAMLGAANASATYTRGESRIELSVTDLGGASALAAAAGAFGMQGSKENADGYERTGPVDGRMTQEEVNRPNRTAKYGVLAGNRIMLEAHGSGITIDDARAAVNTIGIARAEALAAQPPPATPAAPANPTSPG